MHKRKNQKKEKKKRHTLCMNTQAPQHHSLPHIYTYVYQPASMAYMYMYMCIHTQTITYITQCIEERNKKENLEHITKLKFIYSMA